MRYGGHQNDVAPYFVRTMPDLKRTFAAIKTNKEHTVVFLLLMLSTTTTTA